MRYEWQDAKDAANRRRHGFFLEDGIPAVEDPFVHEWIDRRFDYGEERVCGLGLAHGQVLHVVYTMRAGEEVCRLISVRRAEKHEEKDYFAHRP